MLVFLTLLSICGAQFFREDFFSNQYPQNFEARIHDLEARMRGFDELQRKVDLMQKQLQELQGALHSDWVQSDSGSKYKVFENRRTWQESQDTCKTFNGQLVVIDSEDKNKYINDLLSNSSNTVDFAWIGMKTKAEVVNSKAAKFSNFADDVQIDGCAVIDKSGMWSMRSCTQQRPFICQQLIAV